MADGVDLGRHPGPAFSIGYCGIRDADGSRYVGCYSYGRWHRLPARLDLTTHSSRGFNWGCIGSAPFQLALALLCHCTRNPELALQLYQQFNFAIVSRLHRRRWHLSQRFIFRWIRQKLEADGTLCQLRGNGRVEVV
jgi:hypothetical protein